MAQRTALARAQTGAAGYIYIFGNTIEIISSVRKCHEYESSMSNWLRYSASIEEIGLFWGSPKAIWGGQMLSSREWRACYFAVWSRQIAVLQHFTTGIRWSTEQGRQHSYDHISTESATNEISGKRLFA